MPPELLKTLRELMRWLGTLDYAKYGSALSGELLCSMVGRLVCFVNSGNCCFAHQGKADACVDRGRAADRIKRAGYPRGVLFHDPDMLPRQKRI